VPDTPLPPDPSSLARATPDADTAAPPSREALHGTMTQALTDLARITGQIGEGPASWPGLAGPLRALSAELAQAADWLSTMAGDADDHTG
jgi:hypothetical protein